MCKVSFKHIYLHEAMHLDANVHKDTLSTTGAAGNCLCPDRINSLAPAVQGQWQQQDGRR